METKHVLSEQDMEDMDAYLDSSPAYEGTLKVLGELDYFAQPFTSHHPHPLQIWLCAINFAWRINGRGLEMDANKAAILATDAYTHYEGLTRMVLGACVNYILSAQGNEKKYGIADLKFARSMVEQICERLSEERDPYYMEDIDDPSDGFDIDLGKGTVTLGRDEDLHRITVRVMKLMHLKQIYDFTSKELKF